MKKSVPVAILLYCYSAILLAFPVFAQEKPDLTIISPQPEETIFGNQVLFSFFTSNFLLGADGYLLLTIDRKQPLIIKEQKDFSVTNLSQGKHILIAELVDKKIKSLSSPIKKEVNFFSVVVQEEKGIVLEISPPEKEKKVAEGNLLLLSLGLLGLSSGVFLILASKFHINPKTGQDCSY